MNGASRPSASPTVSIEPEPAGVGSAARDHFTKSIRESRAAIMRRELSLPVDRPVVMTGHQASWFHPGILAKYIACQSLAEQLGGAVAWVVPDQDEASFTTIDAPVHDADGALSRETLQLTSGASGVAAASMPPFQIDEIALAGEAATRTVTSGLASLKKAMNDHRDARTAARQVSRAVTDLMSSLIPSAPTLFASELHRTSLFSELIELMAADPEGVTGHYNAAVARHPEAKVMPLERDAVRGRFELPLWRLAPGEPRRAVYADELAEIPRKQLAPKALLFTGMLRLAACDVFIHGTGGGAYDRITEVWFKRWLDVMLAPMMTVTATLTLPLADDAPDEADAHEAAARAHRALHHPAVIGLTAAQEQRDQLARRVEAAKKNGHDPSAEFRALHDFLEAYRVQHHEAINDLRARAETIRVRTNGSDVAGDRTWPFFFHDESALHSLDDLIRRRIESRTISTVA